MAASLTHPTDLASHSAAPARDSKTLRPFPVPADHAADRLAQQISFLLEIDRLKDVLRRSLVLSGERRENSAEHSWHLALMALFLAEYAPDPKPDIAHVLKLVLIHDLVEIDAGDTYCYDAAANADKPEREQRAAERIFGLLPPEQSNLVRALWEEFEERKTPEARFANALDRFQPLLQNFHTNGQSWEQHRVTLSQVLSRNSIIHDGAPALWQHARELIAEAVNRGHILREDSAAA